MKNARRVIYALPVAFWLAASGANAQSGTSESLEQTYARLCANGQRNEACEALRAALLQKLSGGSATAPTSTATPVRSAAATVSPRWGFWSQLAGTSWLSDNGSVYSYAWQTPGAVLTAEILTANEALNAVITPSPDGSTLALRLRAQTYVLQPQSDGSFLQPLSETQRSRYSFTADQMILTQEVLKEGIWYLGQSARTTRRRMQASEIAGHKAELAQRRQEVATTIARDWGVMPRLIGQKFLRVNRENPQNNTVVTFAWLDRGREAAASWNWLATGESAGWLKLTRDVATGRIEARNDRGMQGYASMSAGGRQMRVAWNPTRESQRSGTMITDYYLVPGGLQEDGYFLKNGSKLKSSVSIHSIVTGRSDEELRATVAQQQRSAQQTAQANARKKSGGGLLGVVQGAIGGATGVANAGGGGSEVMFGGAVGAIAGGAGVDPGTINTSMAAATQASAPSASPASGNALTGTRAAGGSYPTKENALKGKAACSMMNESNYQQVGLSPGGDVQLKTMCAHAYEFYVAYKRAIAQGYSQADAERTYVAHQQSALVAIRFHAGQ